MQLKYISKYKFIFLFEEFKIFFEKKIELTKSEIENL